MTLRRVAATRYVTPLREGGSLPAIVEADDDGMYVLKFRGAGQGPKALIAELVAGELARSAQLPVPEIVLMDLDQVLARNEADSDIRELVLASGGLNIALDYLPGSVTFDPVVNKPDPELASDIVWFDAFVANVDRTVRNTNMLIWHRRLWLIDHGASLYLHHTGGGFAARGRESFAQARDHVLLPFAGALEAADARMSARLTAAVLNRAVDLIPDEWLDDERRGVSAEEQRDAYRRYLLTRLEPPHTFLEDALGAG